MMRWSFSENWREELRVVFLGFDLSVRECAVVEGKCSVQLLQSRYGYTYGPKWTLAVPIWGFHFGIVFGLNPLIAHAPGKYSLRLGLLGEDHILLAKKNKTVKRKKEIWHGG
ncbi:MAG: hypothetical protein GX971_02925 [Firmicutes bacterium]|jgi:hypothetical protein|nr:hypothetical protein [Bacillota bacterium]